MDAGKFSVWNKNLKCIFYIMTQHVFNVIQDVYSDIIDSVKFFDRYA